MVNPADPRRRPHSERTVSRHAAPARRSGVARDERRPVLQIPGPAHGGAAQWPAPRPPRGVAKPPPRRRQSQPCLPHVARAADRREQRRCTHVVVPETRSRQRQCQRLIVRCQTAGALQPTAPFDRIATGEFVLAALERLERKRSTLSRFCQRATACCAGAGSGLGGASLGKASLAASGLAASGSDNSSLAGCGLAASGCGASGSAEASGFAGPCSGDPGCVHLGSR